MQLIWGGTNILTIPDLLPIPHCFTSFLPLHTHLFIAGCGLPLAVLHGQKGYQAHCRAGALWGLPWPALPHVAQCCGWLSFHSSA